MDGFEINNAMTVKNEKYLLHLRSVMHKERDINAGVVQGLY